MRTTSSDLFKNVIPLPQWIKKGKGSFVFSKQLRVWDESLDLRIARHTQKLFERVTFSDDFQRAQLVFVLGKLQEIPEEVSAAHRKQAYLLEILPDKIHLQAETSQGLFYGLQTLRQIRFQSKNLPCGRILDWPHLDFRGSHLTLGNGHQPPYEKICEIVIKLASFKLNQFYIEYDGSFSWEKYPFIAGPSALTKDQCRSLMDLAKEYFIEIIPTVDSLGHQEHYLKHPQLQHLRELPHSHAELCPLHPKSKEFIKDLWREILEVHHDAKHVNVTGDEVFRLGAHCSHCTPYAEQGRQADLFFTHYHDLTEWMLNQGKRPMMWHDMLAHYPQRLKDYSKEIMILYWNYYGTDAKKWTVGHGLNSDILPEDLTLFSPELQQLYRPYWLHSSTKPHFTPFPYLRFFQDQGFEVLGASGGSPMVESIPFAGFESRIKNAKSMSNTVHSIQAKGIVHTFWSDYASILTAWTDIAAAGDYSWHSREEKTGAFLDRFDAIYLKSEGKFKSLALQYDRFVYPSIDPKFNVPASIPSPQKELVFQRELKEMPQKCKGDRELLEMISPSFDLVMAIHEAKRWTHMRLKPLLGKGRDTMIDLSRAFNASTRRVLPEDTGTCLDLQPGMHRSHGVKLWVGNPQRGEKNAVILKGGHYPDGLESVEISLSHQKLDTLFFWHTACYAGTQEIARYEILNDRGEKSIFPIIAGKHLADWNRGAEILPEALVAWQGFSNIHEKGRRMLYLTWWKNPWPERPLKSIRLISTNSPGYLVLVAMTGRKQIGKPALPNRTKLQESQKRVFKLAKQFEKNHLRALQNRCVKEDQTQVLKQSNVAGLKKLSPF
ncbi:MAG: family 20 glycosylhydrolase [Verrucomicrobiota bacterium]